MNAINKYCVTSDCKNGLLCNKCVFSYTVEEKNESFRVDGKGFEDFLRDSGLRESYHRFCENNVDGLDENTLGFFKELNEFMKRHGQLYESESGRVICRSCPIVNETIEIDSAFNAEKHAGHYVIPNGTIAKIYHYNGKIHVNTNAGINGYTFRYGLANYAPMFTMYRKIFDQNEQLKKLLEEGYYFYINAAIPCLVHQDIRKLQCTRGGFENYIHDDRLLPEVSIIGVFKGEEPEILLDTDEFFRSKGVYELLNRSVYHTVGNNNCFFMEIHSRLSTVQEYYEKYNVMPTRTVRNTPCGLVKMTDSHTVKCDDMINVSKPFGGKIGRMPSVLEQTGGYAETFNVPGYDHLSWQIAYECSLAMNEYYTRRFVFKDKCSIKNSNLVNDRFLKSISNNCSAEMKRLSKKPNDVKNEYIKKLSCDLAFYDNVIDRYLIFWDNLQKDSYIFNEFVRMNDTCRNVLNSLVDCDVIAYEGGVIARRG